MIYCNHCGICHGNECYDIKCAVCGEYIRGDSDGLVECQDCFEVFDVEDHEKCPMCHPICVHCGYEMPTDDCHTCTNCGIHFVDYL